MKLALALMLALSGTDVAASALPAHGLLVDGVNRRATAARKVRRKLRASAARRGNRVRIAGRGNNSSSELTAPLIPVMEIDSDGLKKLLQRGEGEAARPLLLNFWATWCGPCRKEFPDLVKIDAEYRGRALEFVLVSADDVSDIKTSVPKFLQEMRAVMPAYLLNATDTEAAIAQVDPAWGGELPATFLFDRQGKLVFKHTGLIDAAELRAAINKVMSDE